MTLYSSHFDTELVQLLRAGGIAVIRTDTLYGVVARADIESAVERVYTVKGRTPTKSPIVLIARPEDMFDRYSQADLDRLSKVWPGKNSIIFPSKEAPSWVTRGNASVAYRLPGDDDLRRLLAQTGPLIAPSANPEGLPPAMDITEAERYFGDAVDIYVDGGRVVDDTPSRLYRLNDDSMERLR